MECGRCLSVVTQTSAQSLMYLAPEIFGLVELLTVSAVHHTLVEIFWGIYGDKNYVDVYVMYF